jgi:multiple sugar transport system ATP-binding protein
MAKLTLNNIYKRYENKGKKKNSQKNDFAVKDLSLDCNDSEFIGILGPSGCGKSTTLRMIAGLEEITKGDILIDGLRINEIHPKDRNIGLAFEDYALYPPLSVYDNIAFNLRAKKVGEKEIRNKITKIAPLLKVDDLLDQRPVKLSGGQKQRVNIARAIIREPKLLLLDEPLSHLDGKMRQILRTEIKRLHTKINCTTIIVTHDQLEAMSLADKIAVMRDGELQQFGTPQEIYENPANEFVANFIGEPPMNLVNVGIRCQEDHLFFIFPGIETMIPVPPKFRSVLREGMQVKMGIRPNDLLIGGPESGGSPVKISVFENLGDERRVSIRIGNGFLTLITEDETVYKNGDEIWLNMKAEKIHLFDIATGERIQV